MEISTHRDAAPGTTVPAIDDATPMPMPAAPDPAWMAAAVRCNPGHVAQLVSGCRAVLMSLSARSDNPSADDVD